jgi:hypothetical protein
MRRRMVSMCIPVYFAVCGREAQRGVFGIAFQPSDKECWGFITQFFEGIYALVMPQTAWVTVNYLTIR